MLTAQQEQRIARLTGLAYLAIFALAIAANFGVVGAIAGAGSPLDTLHEIAAREQAFRLAIAAFFLVLMADLLISWGLFALFERAACQLTRFTVLFRVAYTIGHIAVVLHLVAALRIATGLSALDAFSEAERAGLVQDHLLAHSSGFTMTLLFFGVHLIALGTLIWRTGRMPKAVGVLTAIAGLGYIVDGFLWLVAPELRRAIPGGGLFVVILPALIGEGALMIWLLIFGVKDSASQTLIE